MKFNYTISLDDIKIFQIYNLLLKNNKKIVLQFKIKLVVMLIFSMGVISFLTKDYGYLYVTLFVCTFLPFIIPKKSIIEMYKSRIENRIKKDDYPHYPCNCSIDFNENSFLITTDNITAEIKWNGITDVDITENHFFLYSSPITAFIIPKNSITTNNPEDVEKELIKIADKFKENDLKGIIN